MTDQTDTVATEAQAIIDAALSSLPTEQHDLSDGSQLTVVKTADGYKTFQTRTTDDPEDRVRRVLTLQHVESFCDYVNRWANEWTEIVWDRKQQTIKSILDGPATGSTFADHVAHFEPLPTPEWEHLLPLINNWATHVDSGAYEIECDFRWRLRGEDDLQIRLDFPQLPILQARIFEDYVDKIRADSPDAPLIVGRT